MTVGGFTRIAHVIDYFQPALGYQETFLARNQIDRGNVVRVITSDRYAPILYVGHSSQGILGNRIKGPGTFIEQGIEVVRLNTHLEFLNNLILTGLEQSLMEFRPDAIHVHGVSSITAVRVAMLKRKMGATRVLFDDHMTYNAIRGKWVLPFYTIFRVFFGRTILKNADEIVAVTEETRDFMKSKYGFPYDRIRIIPLGCDTTRFHRDEAKGRELRELYGIASEDTVFCYIGKIISDKGVDLLIRASIELMKRGFNLKILGVGGKDPEYFSLIKNEIASSGLESRFIFLPPVPNRNLYEYYSMADVGIWPKQCSITSLEAMACGIPVIISDKSGATERVSDNKNGFLYDEGNINDLEEKMTRLLARELRTIMGEEARRAAEVLDWGTISEKFEELYSSGE